MDFTYLLDDTHMTIYECSKRSGIPYSTLSDILHGKTPMERSSFRTAFYLSRALGISMEELFDRTYIPERTTFETFKSQTRHEVKLLGDAEFIDKTVSSLVILKYWNLEWFMETFYTLAMVDYLSRINNISMRHEYDFIRDYSLPEVSYPADIMLASRLNPELDIREEAVRNSIPEFIRFNIVEKEVRDVY